ncbi:uncharacterized protein LOC141937138 isoform X4 [Strix uralensis]|uniref:uncharacterized protein LOC141937138 isoform X4 n=1 Tax=Strix uralensis TaxID=36305 RepID=UPI003DA77D12
MTWVDPALRELVGSGTAPPSAMASELPMPVPVCLIENTQTEGLVVQQEALRVLSELTQPVVVVAITGPYRSGKSYLMNRLARQRKGFSLGSSVQSHTKGIWMWCLPHPCQPGHTLVLLDTEGLGDVEKGDTQNDTWIFVLAILLASTIIYNSKGTIDQPAMEQLHYMVKLSDHVKLKAAPKESQDELEDSEKFVLFFPTFIWAVRDFTLQLELDGKEISADDYLENALRLKDVGLSPSLRPVQISLQNLPTLEPIHTPNQLGKSTTAQARGTCSTSFYPTGNSREVQRYNQTRECIRQYFPERKCFVFDQPAHKRDLVHLEELQDDEIDVEFRQQLEKFCSYIWEKSPLKTIPGGYIITGNRSSWRRVRGRIKRRVKRCSAGETGRDLRGDHPERGCAVPGEHGGHPGRDGERGSGERGCDVVPGSDGAAGEAADGDSSGATGAAQTVRAGGAGAVHGAGVQGRHLQLPDGTHKKQRNLALPLPPPPSPWPLALPSSQAEGHHGCWERFDSALHGWALKELPQSAGNAQKELLLLPHLWIFCDSVFCEARGSQHAPCCLVQRCPRVQNALPICHLPAGHPTNCRFDSPWLDCCLS